MTPSSIVLAWRRFGPYHHARADAARKQLPLTTVELSPVDRVYAWDTVEAGERAHRVILAADPDTMSRRALCARVFEVLDELSPAAVAIPGWSERSALMMLMWCLKRGVPRVLMSDSNRHDFARSRAVEALKRRVVSLFDAALVGGSEGARYLAALGIPRRVIFDGYDVVDNAHFAAPDLDAEKRMAAEVPEARFFLTSARFIEKKNLPALLDAFAAYRSRAGGDSWNLVLLGDGDLRGLLEARRGDLRLDACVHFPGFKQYDKLPAWYARAGCFVLPSTTEQWGLVVNEAMAAGLPVIVSNRCGCTPDLVEEGGNGFSVDPHDTNALAQAMYRVAHGAVDRARMGQRSREIIANWGPERFASGLRAAVEAALAAPRRKAHLADRALLELLARR